MPNVPSLAKKRHNNERPTADMESLQLAVSLIFIRLMVSPFIE